MRLASLTALSVLSTGALAAQVPGVTGTLEVVLSRDGRTAVVSDYGGRPAGSTLTVVDVPAARVVRTIALGEYRAPHGLVFLPGDSLVAVTSEATGNVVLVHVGEGAVRRAVPTQAAGSHMVAVGADGVAAFTGNIGSHSVSRLDLRAGTFVRSWPVPNAPEAIGVTPDARTVLVPDMNGDVVRFIDRATRRELGRLAVPGGGPQGITPTPDGRHAFLSLSKQGRVAVIDVAARRIVGTVPAGETPDGVAFTRAVHAR